ncbi:hypothetical protein LDG_7039 [Legionella drancourtii LLAP12]|uniref:Uncharacterized protein n=1 Tax=Legionella drancourtii LLAP12 TaxID=658187 RepID=G9EP58_9GAMM|nr:hypothetical protein LDG_7039 [Legionella drancourtii LLAP12]
MGQGLNFARTVGLLIQRILMSEMQNSSPHAKIHLKGQRQSSAKRLNTL